MYALNIKNKEKSDRVNVAGCACCVERNQWMIGESNYTIFHLEENNSTNKSGTMQAYQYAKRTEEKVKNHLIIIKID